MPKLNEEQLARVADAVRTSYSVASVLRKLGLRVAGANYHTIHNVVRSMQLDMSHWTGRAIARAVTCPWCGRGP